MSGNIAVPLNTLTITARNPETTVPAGRIQLDVRTHPQGGITERGGDDCDDPGKGLALELCGNPAIEDPPTATVADADGNITTLDHTTNLRISSQNCVWIKQELARRIKKTIGANVVQPVGLANGTIAAAGTTPISFTNNTPEEQCYSVCIDVCSAFINTPVGTNEGQTVELQPTGTVNPAVTGAPATVQIDSFTVETDCDDQTFTIPDAGATITVRGCQDSTTITPTGTITPAAIALQPTVDINPLEFVVDPQQPVPAGVAMQLTFNGETCEIFAADNNYNSYSGRVCLGDITVAPGQTFTSDLIADFIGKGQATQQFTASTGELCVNLEQVACAEECS